MEYDRSRIRQVLDHQGRSYRWVAQQIDYNYTHFCDCLSGLKPVTERMAQRVADTVGVPVEWFRTDYPMAEVDYEAEAV